MKDFFAITFYFQKCLYFLLVVGVSERIFTEVSNVLTDVVRAKFYVFELRLCGFIFELNGKREEIVNNTNFRE